MARSAHAVEELPHQSVNLGKQEVLPAANCDSAALLLRLLIALAEDDTDEAIINEGEPYETVIRRLQFYRRNIVEFGNLAKQLIVSKHKS